MNYVTSDPKKVSGEVANAEYEYIIKDKTYGTVTIIVSDGEKYKFSFGVDCRLDPEKIIEDGLREIMRRFLM